MYYYGAELVYKSYKKRIRFTIYTTTGAQPKFRGVLACPAHLHAYDSQGRHTGLNASGGVETNIPDSFYIGRYNYSDPNDTETILLYNTTEEYRFEIVANLTEEISGNESFNFTVEQQTDDTRTTTAHLSVPLTKNTTATLPINLTTTAYTMEIDHDGDGATDETRDPDSIETNYAPTASIIAPETGSIYNAGEPVEFNGTGRDPEDGILTNFSLVWYSDINGAICAGERFSTVNLSAGAHRITLMVNDSVDLCDRDSVTLTIVPPSAASTTPTGAPKYRYRTNEDVYAAGSGFTPGTNVDIHIVQDQDWNDGDPIPADVTGAVETVSVNGGNIVPVLVWHAPLTPGSYDIVIDANRNRVYDAATDGLDSGSPGFIVLANPPPTPPTDVPALTPHGIIALISLLCIIGVSRIRRGFN